MGVRRPLYQVPFVAVVSLLLPGMSQRVQQDLNPLVEFAMQSATCSVTRICRDDLNCRSVNQNLEIQIEDSGVEEGKISAFIIDGSQRIEARPIPSDERSTFLIGWTNDGPAVLVRTAEGQMILTKHYSSKPSVTISYGTCEVTE